MPEKQGWNKGPLITYYSGLGMYTNVLNDLKNIKNAESRILRKTLKKYFPNNKSSSLDTKICVYSNYMKNKKEGENKMEIIEGKIKVEAYLHSMEAGKATELEYDGNVFCLKRQPTEVRKEIFILPKPMNDKRILEATEKTDVLDKGKKIVDNVFENELEVVKKAIQDRKSRKEIIKEIEKFHPQTKAVTHEVYYCSYINYLYPQNKPEYLTVKTQTVKTKPFRKYKKRKPKDAIYFDETYQTWILKEEYAKVTKALHKWQFVSTTESLIKETGLAARRVSATLCTMKKKNEIFIKRENKVPIYKLTF